MHISYQTRYVSPANECEVFNIKPIGDRLPSKQNHITGLKSFTVMGLNGLHSSLPRDFGLLARSCSVGIDGLLAGRVGPLAQ